MTAHREVVVAVIDAKTIHPQRVIDCGLDGCDPRRVVGEFVVAEHPHVDPENAAPVLGHEAARRVGDVRATDARASQPTRPALAR